MGERMLVAWFPDWPITAARTVGGLPAHGPVALVHAAQVVACCDQARGFGVRRGLRLREAQMRCPDLTVAPYDATSDARAFEPALAAIEEHIPGVQVLRPGLCAVRSRGATRYYGSEADAAEQLRQAGLTRSPDIRVGAGDTLFVAEQAALCGTRDAPITVVEPGGSAEFLSPLPIAQLGIPALTAVLTRLGAHTLGQFAALSVEDVRARFGAEGERAHLHARGHDPRRFTPRTPPTLLDRRITFEPALERVDQIAFAVRGIATEFIAAVQHSRLVCTTVRVQITPEQGTISEREWTHPRYFSAPEVVDRVRWQLQGSDHSVDSPIVAVHLWPEQLDSAQHHEAGLWGQGPDERIHHGLSRIQSMLGHDGVLTPVLWGGRMLSERVTLVPWGDAVPPEAARRASLPWPGGDLPGTPPATVYLSPLPVRVLATDGTPVAVTARGAMSAEPVWLAGSEQASAPARRIIAWAGPWPIHQRWWDSSRAAARDRFQLVDEKGDAWLAVLDSDRWWVEARYD